MHFEIAFLKMHSMLICFVSTGQFGSVVASYFTFLRWVFWINTFISIFLCCFVMVPEVSLSSLFCCLLFKLCLYFGGLHVKDIKR